MGETRRKRQPEEEFSVELVWKDAPDGPDRLAQTFDLLLKAARRTGTLPADAEREEIPPITDPIEPTGH